MRSVWNASTDQLLCSAALRGHIGGPHRRLCQAILALLPLPGLWCSGDLHPPLPVHLHSLHDLLHPLHVLPQVRSALGNNTFKAFMMSSILCMNVLRFEIQVWHLCSFYDLHPVCVLAQVRNSLRCKMCSAFLTSVLCMHFVGWGTLSGVMWIFHDLNPIRVCRHVGNSVVCNIHATFTSSFILCTYFLRWNILRCNTCRTFMTCPVRVCS